MASPKIFALLAGLFLFATVAFAYLPPPDDNVGRVIVYGTLIGETFTDGTAMINGGAITAESMTLTGDVWADRGQFSSVAAADTTFGDLTATTGNLQDVTTSSLSASDSSTYQEDLTVQGTVTAGAMTIADATIESLTVLNDANLEGDLKAMSNIQITNDLNVGGDANVQGDILAYMTATVEGDLTVNGPASSENLWSNEATAGSLVAEEANIDNLYVLGDGLLNGTLTIGGDSTVGEDLTVTGSLMANSAMTGGNLWVSGNVSAGGQLTADSGSVGSAYVDGNATVGQDLSVGSNARLGGDLTVGMYGEVDGSISSGATITAVDAIFTTLQVDTASIEELTATFVTTQTLTAQDTTVSGTFVVTGMSTMEDLDVKGTSDWADVTATVVVGDDLAADNLTAGVLTVTGHSTLNTVAVPGTLVSGRPSESDNTSASFENAFADDFTVVELEAQTGNIPTLTSTTTTYQTINGMNGDFGTTTADSAWILDIQGSRATIDNLWADQIDSTEVVSTNLDTDTIVSPLSTVTLLEAMEITTDSLTAEWGWFNNVNSQTVTTNMLESAMATIGDLMSINGTIGDLVSQTGWVEVLYSENGWVDNVSGDTLNYVNGTITDLWTEDFWSWMYNATEGSSTDYFGATIGKTGEGEVATLHVNNDARIQDLMVKTDLMVEGDAAFYEGIMAGEGVVATLTVVGNTHLQQLDVSGASFLTDLTVKRVQVTDEFEANTVTVTNATINMLDVTGDLQVNGTFLVESDTLLGGNLVVSGTTQFQTGSFTRIGSAIITTTDMEAFNMDVANGLFGSITTDDLDVKRTATFQRNMVLAPMRGSTSGAPYSFYTAIVPTALTGTDFHDNFTFPVNTAAVFHSGLATVDQLVISKGDNPSNAGLRITGDGAMDFVGAQLKFRNLVVSNGVYFDNENNAAWLTPDATSQAALSVGGSAPFFTFSSLVDRDLSPPGFAQVTSRFSEPADPSQDLLTLAPGHYTVSGSIYFSLGAPSAASAVNVATAGVEVYDTAAPGAVLSSTTCVANFPSVPGSSFGGSCYFSGVVNVPAGESRTLRTTATWNLSSAPIGTSLRVNSRSSLVVAELFERTSQNL